MKIKKLQIQNYKSLVDLEIIGPNPFSVFAGPNASGKSNIFEAIEFANFIYKVNNPTDVENLFGGYETFLNCNASQKFIRFRYFFNSFESSFIGSYEGFHHPDAKIKVFNADIVSKGFFNYDKYKFSDYSSSAKDYFSQSNIIYSNEIEQFQEKFSRLYIGNNNIQKVRTSTDKLLNSDGENLEKVLGRLLKNKIVKEDFLDTLTILIPGFDKIEIYSDIISGNDTLLLFERYSKRPYKKGVISDGNYNILCLLTAVYQSDEPQFLCIEEPENGLNPYVIKSMVEFFRKQCEEKGHYIWLNTHSQTLVSALRPEELILVDKINGETKIKQFPKDYNLHGLQLDEAWLSNALGGGVPW